MKKLYLVIFMMISGLICLYSQSKKVYDFFIMPDTIRVKIEDGKYIGKIELVIAYTKGDNATLDKLTSTRIEIIDIVKRYISTKSYNELTDATLESNLKMEICQLINENIFETDAVKGVMFLTKEINEL